MKCPACGAAIPPRNPLVTVDIIIETERGIVLIQRNNPPYGWALPGGFVDYGETLEEAARREAMEETGLALKEMRQFHTYSDPARDPRGHTISTVFTARAEGIPVAGDDAGRTALFTQDTLPSLAFDHGVILSDYFASRKSI
jgi:8-oxo-dGTP diphosphatase